MRGRRPEADPRFTFHGSWKRAEHDVDGCGSFAAVERSMSDRLLECPYNMDASSSLPFHAARNVDYLAKDSDRYYAVGKVATLCQDSRTSCLNPCPQPSWWSTTSRASRSCAKQYFSRQAFRSSMPTAVQRPSKSVRSTKGPSICCSQTSSSTLRAFKWPQAPINFPTSTATSWPSARSAYEKTCE